jgi:signal transduction histidine kinase
MAVAVAAAACVVIEQVLEGYAWTSSLAVLLLLAIPVAPMIARSRQQALESARIAQEQAAFRRVATLVARTVPQRELLETVAREVGVLCRADLARLERHETDGTVTVVARWTSGHDRQPVARQDRGPGIGTSIGCPIVVEGRIWGTIAASTKHEAPFSADTQSQIAAFSSLVATGIANANSRDEIAALRAREVTSADDIRGRLGRDLHDGAQQRLVHTVITLKLARQALGDAGGPAVELVDEALEHAERATAELRELAHGILPAALDREGLRAGIETLVARVRLPLELDVTAERLPPAVEATAYFIVAEALTNAVKHAHANRARIRAFVDRGALALEVRDDGVGGARVGGSGLLGLHDRAAALGGHLRVESPLGHGTVVAATLPLTGASLNGA